MSEPRHILDASAVLAVIFDEPGADIIYPMLEEEAEISAVNHSEIVARLIDRGSEPDDIGTTLKYLNLNVVAFDKAQAVAAGELRRSTRAKGLSLGDRACLALAASRGATAVTTDRSWTELELPVTVLFARP